MEKTKKISAQVINLCDRMGLERQTAKMLLMEISVLLKLWNKVSLYFISIIYRKKLEYHANMDPN